MVRKIESGPTSERDRPSKEVKIADCGGEELKEPFSATKEDANEQD